MMDDDNRYIEQRREKLNGLRKLGQAYPNHFDRQHLAGELHGEYENSDKPELEALALQVQLAGRMMPQRDKGKAGFRTEERRVGKAGRARWGPQQ